MDHNASRTTGINNNVIDESAAARYVGYSTFALKAWRRQGRGPAYIRVGRSVRYRVAALDAWLERHTVTPGGTGAPSRVD